MSAQALTFIFFATVDHKKRAEDEYSDNFPNKLLELCYIDESRHSMYKEPKIDYERKLSWAKSLGFGAKIVSKSYLVSVHFRQGEFGSDDGQR